MNNKVRNKIRQSNRIHYKVKTTNNPDHCKIFREITNEVIDLVIKAKDEYKNKLTSELLNRDIPPGKLLNPYKILLKQETHLHFSNMMANFFLFTLLIKLKF